MEMVYIMVDVSSSVPLDSIAIHAYL